MSAPVFPTRPQVINPSLGSDLAGISDLSPTMAESAGRQCYAESIARRLMTPRGALIYDPNYGYDLTGMVNDDLDPNDIPSIASSVAAEAKKDERTVSATATVQFVGPSQVAAAASGIVANPNPIPQGVLVVGLTLDDGTGPFTLTLAASDVTVSLLQVQS